MKRLFMLVMVVPLMAACSLARPLQIEPQRRATAIAPKFNQSYYYFDRDQNVYFVMRSTANDAAGKLVDQVATMRVFWRPKGGVTSLEKSALNATFRYIIMTPDAIGMYEGAGFVRLNSKTGSSRMQARVMDGDLRLSQASAGFVDTLGRAHLNGTFSAAYDDAKAMDMLLDSQQEFFARSMKSKAAGTATAPATVPASLPVGGGVMPSTTPTNGPGAAP